MNNKRKNVKYKWKIREDRIKLHKPNQNKLINKNNKNNKN